MSNKLEEIIKEYTDRFWEVHRSTCLSKDNWTLAKSVEALLPTIIQDSFASALDLALEALPEEKYIDVLRGVPLTGGEVSVGYTKKEKIANFHGFNEALSQARSNINKLKGE